MSNPQKPKISVRSLYKVFGARPEIGLQKIKDGWDRERILAETSNLVALADLSFDIAEGEIFVVMGLSGSGKSTLIRCLNRLVEPTAGEIFVDGTEILKLGVKDLRELRLHRMAMVFQHFALLPDRTVCKNVEFGLKLRGATAKERRSVALEKLRQVGLEEWADKYPSELSGGMQQRVGLARSLAVDPDILLMDEAFSALDPLIRHEMQLELLQLQSRMKRTIVFITHDLDEALLLGNRVAIINEGKLVQLGTPQEILDNPADEYVASFVGNVDRGKVFSAQDVLKSCLIVDQSEPYSAIRDALKNTGQEFAVVTDDQKRPVRVLANADEKPATNSEQSSDLVEVGFCPTNLQVKLVSLYPIFKDRKVVVVVDDSGAVVGTVNPEDVVDQLAVASKKVAAPAASGC